jgi:hypothetical protein
MGRKEEKEFPDVMLPQDIRISVMFRKWEVNPHV